MYCTDHGHAFSAAYASDQERDDLGSWLSSLVSGVVSIGGKVEQAIRPLANAAISLVPGGSAVIAAANAIKPVWNAVTKQIINPGTGAPVTDAQVAAGLVDAAALVKAQEQAKLTAQTVTLGGFTIPKEAVYIGGAAIAALILPRLLGGGGRRR